MKLNLGCGSRILEGFKNVDNYERSNTKLDVICDLTKEFPFEKESCSFILMEQLLEHLEWNEGLNLLGKCYNALEKDGKIRIVIPNFKKIFQKYLENDTDFFKPYIDSLNEDLKYYSRCYEEPIVMRRERKGNLPPAWHLSPKQKDRKKVLERMRYYSQPIEVVDWLIYQYHEHKCLYDFGLLKQILENLGFREVRETGNDIETDSQDPLRVNSSLCVEATK